MNKPTIPRPASAAPAWFTAGCSAGFGCFARMGENEAANVRKTFEVKVFGPSAMIQGVLPGAHQRGRAAGHPGDGGRSERLRHRLGKALCKRARSGKQPGDPVRPVKAIAKTEARGVCGTGLHAAGSDRPLKPALPFTRGHEGIGIVAAPGAGTVPVKMTHITAFSMPRRVGCATARKSTSRVPRSCATC